MEITENEIMPLKDYDYKKSWRYLLSKLGYADTLAEKIIREYQFVIGEGAPGAWPSVTAFHYFKFGGLFYRLELDLAHSLEMLKPGEVVRMRNTLIELRLYIVPKMFDQKELFEL